MQYGGKACLLEVKPQLEMRLLKEHTRLQLRRLQPQLHRARDQAALPVLPFNER